MHQPIAYKLHTTPNSSICSDEGLTLELSAFESLYGGQFTLSTELIKPKNLFWHTVELPIATTSHRRPPLLGDQFSKIPKVSKSNHYIWNLLQASTSRKRPRALLELKCSPFLLFLTSRKRPLHR